MSKRGSRFIKLETRGGSRCLKPEVTMKTQIPLGLMAILERALVNQSPGNEDQIILL